MSVKFGPAGNSKSFFEKGYKHALDVPDYLNQMGLDAFEYQCGRGVNIGEEKARQLGEKAAKSGISLSLHAPYYISMSSIDEEKRLNSINYILASARAADAMGADRIIVHTGSCGKISREEALKLAKDTMKLSLEALDRENLGHIHICPETMGKVNQLGTLDEVLSLCELDKRLIPCIDFGHLNARDLGFFKSFSDYESVFCAIGERLGEERLKSFHSHFSKIEYTAGGERRHLTFADTVYGPDFEPVMELAGKYCESTRFICESDGTQAEDAKTMKEYYNSKKNEK